jgi:hypothetical protein
MITGCHDALKGYKKKLLGQHGVAVLPKLTRIRCKTAINQVNRGLSGLGPMTPLNRINHIFPHEGEVLQSIQQVATSLIHKLNIYIKHPGAFNPKYIRVRK